MLFAMQSQSHKSKSRGGLNDVDVSEQVSISNEAMIWGTTISLKAVSRRPVLRADKYSVVLCFSSTTQRVHLHHLQYLDNTQSRLADDGLVLRVHFYLCVETH